MKPLLTLILAFTVSAGMAQTTKGYIDTSIMQTLTTTSALTTLGDSIARATIGTWSTPKPYIVKVDTARCWFKEIVIKGETVSELWQHGYQVLDTYRDPYAFDYMPPIADYQSIEMYLYPDKTEVKNHVIYSISK